VISLHGGAASALPVASSGNEPPLLLADPNAGQNMTDAARSVLRNIDTVVTDNSEPLRTLIANFNTFSGALARNSERVDGILSGLEKMTGGGAQKAKAHVYDLASPGNIPALAKIPKGQLLIPEPELLGSLFNDDILVTTAAGTRDTSFEGKWPDTLTRVLHARIIQSFENAGYLKVMGRNLEGHKPDHQLLIDVRTFQVQQSPDAAATISFSAKIIGGNGQIAGARIFQESVPVNDKSEVGVAASLNEVFQKAMTELVVWTCATI
jgi:phospholipid/cholesterol/gamma-HCH transport system substrate-binding protein